ncbi:hypothetical protein [Streptomyces sp. NPDC059909]|uniref:hypothetical protein n=1 Tax=Streptomyces sp. NPDC059909 TaxID=3346998 RepID=UPI0036581199
MLAALLLLPTWFLLFGNFVEMLLFPVAGQIVFALCVMRVPLARLPSGEMDDTTAESVHRGRTRTSS